jgi:glycosyltransferase involved in cell wall biosynthesis
MKKLEKIVLYHAAIVNPGGAERLLLEEYTFLTKMGIRTWLLTFQVKKDSLFNYEIPSLEVLSGGDNFLSKVKSLRRRLREINPDLVISACGSSELYTATAFTSIPYVLHIHGSLFRFETELLKYALIHRKVFNEIRDSVRGHKEFIPLKPKCNLKRRITLEFEAIIDYLAVRRAKEIIVLTSQVQWEVKKLYNRRAIVTAGCLDPKILSYVPKHDIKKALGIDNARIILSVSRLDPRKRIDVLIKAFAELSKEMGPLVLVIVGAGPDEKRLKSLASKLNLSNEIMFTGYVCDDELWDFYSACDVFATPAWADFDIAPFEALAMGKSVVWSSEMSEDLQRGDYVIVADPSINGFAEGIKTALMKKVNGKLDLQDFTWESYFKDLFKIEKDC